MERIAVIFEAEDEALERPSEVFSDEYAACLSIPFFFPVLANLAQVSRGEELVVNHPSPVKHMYCFIRTRELGYNRRTQLEHALKRSGYVLAMFDGYPPSLFHEAVEHIIEASEPERVQPYYRHLTRNKKHSWFPDSLTPQRILPAVLKFPSGQILRNPDGSPRVFRESLRKYEADEIIAEALGSEVDAYTDTYRKAPLWFERYVNIAIEHDTPVEWRAYYYLDRLFYLCPKERIAQRLSISVPPKSMVAVPPDWGMFCSVDYALDTNGRWWALSRREGQFSLLPTGANPADFLQNLAREIKHGYDYPDWAWCATGTIVQRHRIGERKVEVSGTRYFKAGQKDYVVDGYFGQGAEHCTIIGKPKHSDRYICVDMETDLIENFAVERVIEDIILRAIYTRRLYEEFPRSRTHIRSCWGNDDEDLKDVKGFVDSANKYYRKTWAPKPGYREGESAGNE